VAAEARKSHKLEKLCRYIARPSINEKRLSISPQARVRYQLKTPWRNGTTHVDWDAVDFIAKLAVLVPPPRAHRTRFHVFVAPNAALRAQLTPAGRGKRPIKHVVHTLTADNGKEFAEHELIAIACKRAYLPKGTDFATVSDERLREIERRINSRP
jgi:IS30 family transposase